MLICKICKKECKNLNSLSIHVVKKHKINKKEYYDLYLKNNDNIGICLNCGNDCNFISLSKGYHDFCSGKCAKSKKFNKLIGAKISKESIEKRKQTNIERYGVENTYQ